MISVVSIAVFHFFFLVLRRELLKIVFEAWTTLYFDPSAAH